MSKKIAFRAFTASLPYKCWHHTCQNYIHSPWSKKFGYCCQQCARTQTAQHKDYHACHTCDRPMLRVSPGIYCDGCARARAPQIERLDLAEKQCAWDHCQTIFVPRRTNQKYCQSTCGRWLRILKS